MSELGIVIDRQYTLSDDPCHQHESSYPQMMAIAQGQRSLIVNTSAVLPSARSEDPSRKVTAMPASVEATEIMSATGRLLSPMVISDPEILSLETIFIKGFSRFK